MLQNERQADVRAETETDEIEVTPEMIEAGREVYDRLAVARFLSRGDDSDSHLPGHAIPGERQVSILGERRGFASFDSALINKVRQRHVAKYMYRGCRKS